ncbi:metallophosphoesterase [Acidobacteria bacterium AB60]|nr:metallophosphoesterase [Acidobacteria bacterium AB60]
MKVWPVLGVVLLQVFLLSAHWFIFQTLVTFLPFSPYGERNLAIALFALGVSFVVAALLGFYYSNLLVEFVYRFAATWLGMLNFIFWASCLCWIVRAAFVATHCDTLLARERIAKILFGLAILVSFYGMLNARRIRKRRLSITLPGLPASWRNRTALLITDMHLGNVNGAGFARRIVGIARRLDPHIIFIAGDLFDGSKADPDRIAHPLFALAPPFGVYFSGGNHEDFGDREQYEAALMRGGVHVLHNRRVDVDGLQVVGVSYADSTHPMQLRSFLESLHLNGGPASVLLNHVPSRLPIVETAGVTLQLSGHTHGGQIFPFTWITRRAFGKFTYGLHSYGRLQVLTSSGVGTWGPPMRVGTAPEVLLITFT